MPFLTEEIWQALPHQGNTIVLGPFPQENKDWEAPDIEAAFTKLEQFVNATRTSRALLNCGPSQSLIFLGTSKNANELDTLNQVHHHLQHLSRGTVQLSEDDNWPSTNILRLVVGSIVVGIKIEGDIDLQNALKRIKKQIQEKQKEITRLEKRLASPDFVAKAEPEVVQESTERLKVLKEEMALLMSSEAQLQTMLGK
jgi:valyl-tRNA synthetase